MADPDVRRINGRCVGDQTAVASPVNLHGANPSPPVILMRYAGHQGRAEMMPAEHNDAAPRVPGMALLGGMYLRIALSILLRGAAEADGPFSDGRIPRREGAGTGGEARRAASMRERL